MRERQAKTLLKLDYNIIFTVINILILYFLLRRFLFKPINAILEKRQAEVEEKFAEAGEIEAAAKQSRVDYEEKIANVDSEKAQIMAEARSNAGAEYGRIVSDAKNQAESIIEKAKHDAQVEKAAIMSEVDREMKDMIVSAASRVAGLHEDCENDSALYERFLSEISDDAVSMTERN